MISHIIGLINCKIKLNIAKKTDKKFVIGLEQNNLVLIESEKEQPTCIIGESKVKSMMQKELSKTERYTPVNLDPTKTRQVYNGPRAVKFISAKRQNFWSKMIFEQKQVKKMHISCIIID